MADFLNDLLRIGKKVIEASEALQAEIDKREPKPRPKSTPSQSTSSSSDSASVGGSASPAQDLSSLYVKHLMSGCPDPLSLLTVEDAERLMRCAISTPVTTGEEEYIGAHYGCEDDRSMYVSLSVSALMPWDYVQSEVTTSPAPQSVGDEAMISDDMLYVRSGDRFFWLYGRGVEDSTIYAIANHVAAKMAAS